MAKWAQLIFDRVIALGIIFTGLLFALISLSQLQYSPVIFLFSLLGIGLALFTLLYWAKKITGKKAAYICAAVIFLSVIVGLAILYMFETPLVVEPSYVFDYASKWVSGPSSSLHALVWNHWGNYGLLLSLIFKLSGPSIVAMKLLGIASLAMFSCSLLVLYIRSGKASAVAIAAVIISLYPMALTFLNYPTGDMIYIGLLGPLLILSQMLVDTTSPRQYIYVVILLGTVVAFQNMFKDAFIVFMPIFTVCSSYFFLKTKSYYKLYLTPIFLLILFVGITTAGSGILSHYAKGRVNDSKVGYFLATGTSYSTQGLFNGNYYYGSLWYPLESAYGNNKLTKEVYKERDRHFFGVARENIRTMGTRAISFAMKKVQNIWLSDKPIIRQTSFDDTGASGYKFTRMEKYSNYFYGTSDVWYYAIVVLFVYNCFATVRSKDKDFLNVLSVFMTIGLFSAFTVMEGQPRYRLIIMPFMIVAASYGLVRLTEDIRKLINKKGC